MSKIVWNNFWRDLVAFVPVYDDFGGNSTRIYFTNRESVFLEEKTRTVLNNLSSYFARDLKALRKKYGLLLGRKNFVPLALHPFLILLPLKYRRPERKDEGALAYFALDKISDFKSEGKKTKIYLCQSQCLEVLQSFDSVNLLYNQAFMVKRDLVSNLEIREEELLYQGLRDFLKKLS